MKKVIMIMAMLAVSFSFAQTERTLTHNKDTNLIDVTYYHYNGKVSQTGSYTIDGKLHGEWLSFNIKGEKTVLANYKAGKKVGKWFYWEGSDILKEVDYSKNQIAQVNEWVNKKTSVAIRDKK